MTGTHVAASHVSGVAALYLGDHPRATPREVGRELARAAVDDALTGVPTAETPNALLQVPTRCR
jgi:subtilisin family serine protease